MKPHSIFLFAGETSGDMHGEKIIYALRKKLPNTHFFGVGGSKMRAAGLECLIPMEKFQVMGFVDVFFALPSLLYHFLALRKTVLKQNPDVVFFIDYPGFNLALAKSLFKRKFAGKICHYICPSVWAWGKNRVGKMEKILDHLFVIFPFEQKLFNSEKKLKVNYVGHPLVQICQKKSPPLEIADPKNKVIAIFPGSRLKELERNFPIQIKVAKKILVNHSNVIFAISVTQPSFSPILEEMIRTEKFHAEGRLFFISSDQNSNLMKRANLAIAKSGTNNLELALHGVPTVVTYGIGSLDLFIAKYLLRIRLPYYCIVNILAGKQVYPELIGPNLTEDRLYHEVDQFLSSPSASQECREKCLEIGRILEEKIPEEEIAVTISNFLQK